MQDEYLKTTADGVERVLRDRGLGHLHVRVYGKHVILHSGEPGDGENRARLTRLNLQHFRLDMVDHRGRWEPTPFMGTWPDLLTQLIDDFGFTLVPW